MLFVLNCINILAQEDEIKFRHLNVKNGLSSSWVRSIFQDRDGFLWFGTGGNGINKYDGYDFKVYKNNPRDTNSLSNNNINAIFEDRKGIIWVATRGGVNYYDKENDRFVRFGPLKTTFCTGFYEDHEGRLYVIGGSNLFEIDFDRKIRIPFCSASTGCMPESFFDALVEDVNGNLWAASSVGLFLIDLKNKSYTIFKHDDKNPYSISENSIECISNDSEGRIWIGTTHKGLCLMKFKDGKSSQPYFINFFHNPHDANSISKGCIRDILDDGNGNLWIGTENGGLDILDLRNFNKGNFHACHYMHDIYNESSLSNNSIYALYKDRQGTIWVGTYGDGVSYYNELMFKFRHYCHSPGNPKSINNNTVNTIYKKGNELYIGTEGGLNILNTKTNSIRVFKNQPDNSKSIASDAIWSIYEDNHNNIWIGAWDGGLNLFDSKSGTFTRYLHNENNPNTLGSNNVFDILEDKEGYLWIACMSGGLSRFDPRNQTFKTFHVDYANRNSISDDWVNTILESSYGELWISNSTSVDVYNKSAKTFTYFINNTKDKSSISYNGAIVFYEDSKRNMWIGTEGGLNMFVREKGNFIYYREEDGLPDNSVKGICEDDHGNLWLSTNNGLSKFIKGINHLKTPVFRNYGEADGLQAKEFGRHAFYKDQEGCMYFGGINGFNVFHPDSILENLMIPPIVITNLLLSNEAIEIGKENSPLKKQILLTDEVILDYKQTVISIEYAALNFISPEKNQYKYILEGFDKEWQKAGNKREARYTNLDAGKYIFRVIGSNNDGVWNNKGASLTIVILPPWWETLWFRVFALILIISFVLGFYLYRVSSLEKRRKILEQSVKERTREVEDKNHELSEQTTVLNEVNQLLRDRQNTIQKQSEILKSQTEELKKMNTSLASLNSTKDKFFSIIAHDLKNPFNSILGFSELLKKNYEKMTDEKRKHYIGVIFESSGVVFNLLENLLQWSRSQTDRIIFEPIAIDIEKVLKDNIALLKDTFRIKSLTVYLNGNGTVEVFADTNMVNTIVRNLLNNAIKFSHKKSSLYVTYSKKKEFVEVSIKDTGIGMSVKEREQLFILDKGFSRQGTAGEIGTGLGLVLCHEFVTQNRGKIWVESEPGKGSNFIFTLPCVQ